MGFAVQRVRQTLLWTGPEPKSNSFLNHTMDLFTHKSSCPDVMDDVNHVAWVAIGGKLRNLFLKDSVRKTALSFKKLKKKNFKFLEWLLLWLLVNCDVVLHQPQGNTMSNNI